MGEKKAKSGRVDNPGNAKNIRSFRIFDFFSKFCNTMMT